MFVTFANSHHNLDSLRAHRDTMHDLMERWISGEDVDPDMYAAANTPDEVFDIPGLAPAGWKELKAEFEIEADRLVAAAWDSRRYVRIASGHEKIRKLTIQPTV